MHYIIFYVLIYLRLPSLKYNIFIWLRVIYISIIMPNIISYYIFVVKVNTDVGWMLWIR